MSLREEIKELIKDCKLNRNPNLDWYTDEIISKIEKRIDSCLPSSETPPDLGPELTAFHHGFVCGIKKVKEMLKS